MYIILWNRRISSFCPLNGAELASIPTFKRLNERYRFLSQSNWLLKILISSLLSQLSIIFWNNYDFMGNFSLRKNKENIGIIIYKRSHMMLSRSFGYYECYRGYTTLSSLPTILCRTPAYHRECQRASWVHYRMFPNRVRHLFLRSDGSYGRFGRFTWWLWIGGLPRGALT